MGRHAKPCVYTEQWTDEVGDIPVCDLHNHNSRWPVTAESPNPPCLEMDPWVWMTSGICGGQAELLHELCIVSQLPHRPHVVRVHKSEKEA